MSLPQLDSLPGQWVPAGQDVLAARDVEHEPVLQPWRTAIWAEAGGQIRGGGVLTSATVQGGELRLECVGLSGASVAGLPWTAAYRRYLQADPLDIVRDIYGHVQSFENGNLGLQVDDTSTPVRVGLPEDPTRKAARLAADASKATLDDAKKTLDKAKAHAETTRKAALRAAGLKDMTGKVVVAELDKDGDPPSKTAKNVWYRPSKNRAHKVVERMEGKVRRTAWEAVPAALADTRTAAAALKAEEAAKKAYDDAKKVADKARDTYAKVRDRQEEDPYVLHWSSTHDLGKVIDDLATDTPFDMVERTVWDGDHLRHRLEIRYPRRGTRRTDLRFVIGENVMVPRDAVAGGDYASDIQVLGAGEGAKMVRSLQGTGAPGIRRVRVHTDKTITKDRDADLRARALAPALHGALSITDLAVMDHPNAPVGALTVGDEIYLQGRIDWTEVDMWLRVETITHRPDRPDVIALSVTRSVEGA